MAINVNTAYNQANQMSSSINQLRQARSKLLAYKSSITSNWESAEVGYVCTAIDQAISQIDRLISDIDSLSNDVKSVANQIKREEDAAAAAARAKALKEQQIRTAQNNYNKAKASFDNLVNERAALEKKYSRASLFDKIRINEQLKELNKKIQKAESECNAAYSALQRAKK